MKKYSNDVKMKVDWIKIEDQKPDENDQVWLKAKSHDGKEYVFIGSWSSDWDNWWWNAATEAPTLSEAYGWEMDEESDDYDVTHWFPLPTLEYAVKLNQ